MIVVEPIGGDGSTDDDWEGSVNKVTRVMKKAISDQGTALTRLLKVEIDTLKKSVRGTDETLQAQLQSEVGSLKKQIEAKFDDINCNFNDINSSFNDINSKFDEMK